MPSGTVTVPACAPERGLVDLLLGELARGRGVTVDVIRITHGLPPTLYAPEQGSDLVREEVK